MASAFARAKRLIARFAGARRGATAVEFAIVGAPFLMLLFAVLELGMVFMVSTQLEGATDEAARTIRTGQAQSTSQTAAAFKTSICNDMLWLASDCTAKLSVDVRTFANFSAVTSTSPVSGGVFDSSKMCWDPGAAGSIVLVRAYYQWKLFTPLLSTGLQQLSNGSRLITSTSTFRNEPYSTTPATPVTCP